MSLKILQLISSSGFFGAENVLLELSCELKALGHSVTVGVFQNLHNPNMELRQSAREHGLDTHVFRCSGKADLGTISAIASFVRKNSFDIVHSHGYKSNIYAVLSNIRNTRPMVATCHNWIVSSGKMGMYTMLDKMFLKRFDAVVPVSANVRELLLKAGIGKDRVFLIENGINTRRFGSAGADVALRSALFKGGGTVIGTVGRLTGEKGHTYLLKAARKVLDRHGDCFFLIVGEGPLRAPLEEEAERLGISERTVFAGRRSDIPALLSVMDIFVLPSLTEGQPMALLEAMAAGRPIAASSVGDIPKILKNGEIGRIVPPGDAPALADVILGYMDDRRAARRCADGALAEVARRYSSVRMAEQYLSVYESLIN
ncbi:MAG: glycosyltransferase family 4 protein [Thermodesulfobacteriota bacterium]